jgi:alpha-ketoglutarate-dependent taurine dioxygenase
MKPGFALTTMPIAGALGAEIHGVDLSQPLVDDVVAGIRQALLDHLVVFFRDQRLSPAQLIAFGRRFGTLAKYPYADSGAPRLRALAMLGDFVFICRDDLPAASAYMLTEALAERWGDIDPALVRAAPSPRPASTLPIPLHPGALEYYRGHE